MLSSIEVYPNTSGCSTLSLPSSRSGHTVIVTSDPTALVAICGGHTYSGFDSSCLVLDQRNQRWDGSRMGSLTMKRHYGAAARLNHIGVFIVGGGLTNNSRTSEFLAAGTMQWQEGPALPVDMDEPCAVTITDTSFLVIQGTDIHEFEAASETWREAGRWPKLQRSRTQMPGCAKIGQKVIIAGGQSGRSSSSTTDVLDLANRQITPGGEMARAKKFFHIATIISEG